MGEKRQGKDVESLIVIDIYNPKYWKDFDWENFDKSKKVPIKSQNVNRRRANQLKAQDKEMVARRSESIRKTRRGPNAEAINKKMKANRPADWLENARAGQRATIEKRSRPYVALGVTYKNQPEAAKASGIHLMSLRSRARHRPNEYYFVDEGPGPAPTNISKNPNNGYAKSVTCLGKKYKSKSDACRALKVTGKKLRRLFAEDPKNYYLND